MATYHKPKTHPATPRDFYAFGGPVIGTRSRFAKGDDAATTRSRFLRTIDSFRHDSERADFAKTGKGGSMSKLAGDSKSEKPVKPRA